MSTVQTLLNQFGSPPQEICLDWAWQLEQLGQPSNSSASSTAPDPERPAVQLAWDDLTLDDQGRLTLLHPEGCAPWSTDNLFDQLYAWSTSGAATELDEATRDRRQFLTEQTLKLYTALEPEMVPLASHPADSTKFSAGPLSSTKALAPRGGKLVPATAPGSTIPAASSRSRWNLIRKLTAIKNFIKPFFPMRIVFPLCGLALCIWGIQHFQRDPPPSSTADSSPTSVVAHPSDTTASDNSEISPVETIDLQTLAGSLHDTGDTLHALPPKAPSDNSANVVQTLDQLASDVILSEGSSASPTESSGLASEPATPLAASRASLRQRSAAAPVPSKETDVMSTLEATVRAAEAAQTEAELLATTAPHTEKTHPAILLNTFPMLQVQKLPSKLAVRAKHLGWTLRLEASDGFEIEPSVAQTIQGRDVASWTIREKDSPTPATLVRVDARQIGARGTSIRWRIAAGAEDLPQIALPLAGTYLDTLQATLSQFDTRLRGHLDRLAASTRSGSIPSELRGTLRAQQRYYEAQHELASRLLEVVAEANLIEGWMDGQLQVHAQCVDVSLPESPPLIQFGAPISAPAVAPETSPGMLEDDGGATPPPDMETPSSVSSDK